MNYETYFLTAHHGDISFQTAFSMLCGLLTVTTRTKEQSLWEKCKPFKYPYESKKRANPLPVLPPIEI